MNLQNKETPRIWTGCWGEGIVRELGMDMYTLLYSKWITNKDLLYSRWNFAQCYGPAWMLGVFGGEWIHVHIWLNPFAIHLKLSQHCQSTIHQHKIIFFIFSFFKLKHSWYTILCYNDSWFLKIIFISQLFLMLVTLCSKSFKIEFISLCTKKFQMYKLHLKKAEEPEIKLSTFAGSQRKQGNSRKTSTSDSLTMLKTLYGSQHIRPPYLSPKEPLCKSRINRTRHGTMDCY